MKSRRITTLAPWRYSFAGVCAAAAMALAGCGGSATLGGAAAGETTAASASVAVNTTQAAAPATTGAIPASCDTAPDAGAYVALAQHRPDVLSFYAKNGWNVQTQCHQVFDNWLSHGPDGKPPTTATAFVAAQGWPTPTPSTK